MTDTTTTPNEAEAVTEQALGELEHLDPNDLQVGDNVREYAEPEQAVPRQHRRTRCPGAPHRDSPPRRCGGGPQRFSIQFPCCCRSVWRGGVLPWL